MIFKDPLYLLMIFFVLILVFLTKRQAGPGIRFFSVELLKGLKRTFKLRFEKNIIFIRALSVIAIILAMARPQAALDASKIHAEGIDIVLAMDCSTSMLAEDFMLGARRASRFDAAKKVADDFILGRKNDRIGLIVFARRAYTVCPLTLDHDWLMKNFDRIKVGIMGDGTAVGSGIMTSLNRLKDTLAKGKVVIVLTDGRNNIGDISPVTAAEAAKALGIKVYTIGAGSKGLAPYPVKDPFGKVFYQPIQLDLDEDTLEEIASMTEGKYFRATDTKSLKNIYAEINKLEKVPIEEKGYVEYRELFGLFLVPGLLLLCLEIVLRNTWLRKVP